MDLESWPASQRAAHYQNRADKLRDLAAGEPATRVRDRLLALAAEYQELADNLRLPQRA